MFTLERRKLELEVLKAEIEDRKTLRAEAKAKKESDSFIASGEFLHSSGF